MKPRLTKLRVPAHRHHGVHPSTTSAMTGGILMVAVSYFISCALLMSSVCLGIVAAVYFKRDH